MHQEPVQSQDGRRWVLPWTGLIFHTWIFTMERAVALAIQWISPRVSQESDWPSRRGWYMGGTQIGRRPPNATSIPSQLLCCWVRPGNLRVQRRWAMNRPVSPSEKITSDKNSSSFWKQITEESQHIWNHEKLILQTIIVPESYSSNYLLINCPPMLSL